MISYMNYGVCTLIMCLLWYRPSICRERSGAALFQVVQTFIENDLKLEIFELI